MILDIRDPAYLCFSSFYDTIPNHVVHVYELTKHKNIVTVANVQKISNAHNVMIGITLRILLRGRELQETK